MAVKNPRPDTNPAGNDTEIQFNDGGSFGAESTFTYEIDGFDSSFKVLQHAASTGSGLQYTGSESYSNMKLESTYGRALAFSAGPNSTGLGFSMGFSFTQSSTVLDIKGDNWTTSGGLIVRYWNDHRLPPLVEYHGEHIFGYQGTGGDAASPCLSVYTAGGFYPADTNALGISTGGVEAVRFNSDQSTTFNDAFTFPVADGTANQFLQTDGAGNVDWATVDLSGYVPYTGATADVDLGAYTLETGKVTVSGTTVPEVELNQTLSSGYALMRYRLDDGLTKYFIGYGTTHSAQASQLSFKNTTGTISFLVGGTSYPTNRIAEFFSDRMEVAGGTSGISVIQQGLTVNEGGTGTANDDFRVETLNQANAFLVDASADQINVAVDLVSTQDITCDTLHYTTLDPAVDLSGYVPYTGAIANVDLGSNQLTATRINTDTLGEDTSGNGIEVVANSFYKFNNATTARGLYAFDWQGISSSSYVASGTYSAILGGSYNRASGSYAAILGGRYNTATTSYAVAIGGYSSDANGAYSFVAGGYNNRAAASYSAVIGGYQCNIEYSGSSGFVAGSYAALLYGNYGLILGCDQGTIGNNANNSSLIGCKNSTVANNAYYSGAIACKSATLSSKYGYALSSKDVTISAWRATALNLTNANVDLFGMNAHGQVKDGANGRPKSYCGNLTPHTTTTDITQTILHLANTLEGGGSVKKIDIKDGDVWGFSGTILAARRDAPEVARWKIEATVERASGVVTLNYGVATKQFDESASRNVYLSVDDVNKILEIKVVGQSGVTIDWLCNLNFERISNTGGYGSSS